MKLMVERYPEWYHEQILSYWGSHVIPKHCVTNIWDAEGSGLFLLPHRLLALPHVYLVWAPWLFSYVTQNAALMRVSLP